MGMRVGCYWCILFCLGASGVFLGCQDQATSVSNAPIFSAWVEADDSYYDEGLDSTITLNNIEISGTVQNSPRASNISMTLGGKAPAKSSTVLNLTYGQVFVGDYLNEAFTGTKTVAITSNEGSASGTITIPNPTVLVSPTDGDSVSPYQDINVTWTGNAEWYVLYVGAVDRAYNYTPLYDDSVVSATNVVIRALAIPAAAVRLAINVSGFNGPMPVAGAIGNMTGAGPGFLFSMDDLGDYTDRSANVYLRGRSSAKVLAQPKQDERHEDPRNIILEKLSKQW